MHGLDTIEKQNAPAEITISRPQAEKPTVGRIVHYQSYGSPNGEYASLPRAAVVTEVYPDSSEVGLCILNPTGIFFTQHVKFSETPKAGSWNWPKRG